MKFLLTLLCLFVLVLSASAQQPPAQENYLDERGFPLQKEHPGTGTIIIDTKPLLNQQYLVPVKKLDWSSPVLKSRIPDPLSLPEVPNFVTVDTATITHSGIWKKVFAHRVDGSAKAADKFTYATTQTISKETADEISAGLSLGVSTEVAPLGVGVELSVKATLEFARTLAKGEANGTGWELEITVQPGYTQEIWERRLKTEVTIDWSKMTSEQLVAVYSQMLARKDTRAASGAAFDERFEIQRKFHQDGVDAKVPAFTEVMEAMRSWGPQHYKFELPAKEMYTTQYANRRGRLRVSDITGLDARGYPVQKDHGRILEIPFPAETIPDKYRLPVEKILDWSSSPVLKSRIPDPLSLPEVPNFVTVPATVTTTGKWTRRHHHSVAKDATDPQTTSYSTTTEISKTQSNEVRAGLEVGATTKAAPFGVGVNVSVEASLGFAHSISHGQATGKEWKTSKEVQPGTTAVFWQREVEVTVVVDWSKMTSEQLVAVYSQMLARKDTRAASGAAFDERFEIQRKFHQDGVDAKVPAFTEVMEAMRSLKTKPLSYTLPAKEVYVTEYTTR